MIRLISRQRLAFRSVLGLLFLAAACVADHAQPPTAGTVEIQRELMGTIVSVQTYGLPAQAAKPAIEGAFAAIEELQRLAHPQWESSEIRQLNRQAGRTAVKLSPPIYEIVALAHEVSEHSRGAFDVTYAGVGRLYNLQDPHAPLPTADQLAAALQTIDYRKLILSAADRTAFLQEPGMQVNLGGIAKGWSAQSAMAALRKQGVQNAIVNAGGDMTIIGSKNGVPWKIGIQHPRKPRGELYA
ncbi:MAG TPA: FAD:protein FMN transferase, partial [bacterium]|nr:FAD:protein FMN transferase [bacterium]